MYKPTEEQRYFVMFMQEEEHNRYMYKGAIYDGAIARSGGYVVLFPKNQIINGRGEIEDCYLPATQDEMATGVIINSELFQLITPLDRTEIIRLENEEEERPAVTSSA